MHVASFAAGVTLDYVSINLPKIAFVRNAVKYSPTVSLGQSLRTSHALASLPFSRFAGRTPLSSPFESHALKQPVRHCTTSAVMLLNGEARNKRKTSPVHVNDRPSKVLKPGAVYTNGSASPSEHEPYAYSPSSLDEELLQQPGAATADTAEWQATIEQVVRNVVSIHFCQTCSFDTDAAVSSEATGFVVDAERGYILTNRHVVGAGPFWGYCIFDNHEEVEPSSSSRPAF